MSYQLSTVCAGAMASSIIDVVMTVLAGRVVDALSLAAGYLGAMICCRRM